MELRLLATFVTTARLLSFTRAAEELGYAQSTVTGQIQALEEELGVPLYERFGKQVKLTKDGEHLFAYATQIIKLSDEAKTSLADPDSRPGALTVGTAESLCLHRLPAVFSQLRRRYPRLAININFDAVADYSAQLRKNSIDVAFFLDVPCRENDLITHVLFEEPMALIAAPGHPLLAVPGVAPGDLGGEALVLTHDGCTYRRVFEGILMQAGAKPSSCMGLSSNEVIKRFVADGWGIGFLPRVVVQSELAAGQLGELRWAGPPFGIYVQLVYHKNKWLSTPLKAFIETVLATVRPPETAEPARPLAAAGREKFVPGSGLSRTGNI